MAKERYEEIIAKEVIEHVMGVPVEVHDDGSKTGMFDLKATLPDGTATAIEVVRILKEKWMALLNDAMVKGPFSIPIEGGWYIGIQERANIRVVLKNLPMLVSEMQASNLKEFWVNSSFLAITLYKKCKELGVYSITPASWLKDGQVQFQLEPISFIYNDAGKGVSESLSSYLNGDKTKDVRRKLGESGAKHREAFIWAGMTGENPDLEVYLQGSLDSLPGANVQLPPEITAVWLVGSPTRGGVRYDGNNWHKIEPFLDLVK